MDPLDEIEVICAQCSYPIMSATHHDGRVVGFQMVEGPATIEEALSQGWTDTGMGLYCPKCSANRAAETMVEEEPIAGLSVFKLVKDRIVEPPLPPKKTRKSRRKS